MVLMSTAWPRIRLRAAEIRGIAVRTDHTVESEVEQLFARVRAEAGRLDVLVNDIWGGDALTIWRRTRSSGSPTRWPPTSMPTM